MASRVGNPFPKKVAALLPKTEYILIYNLTYIIVKKKQKKKKKKHL